MTQEKNLPPRDTALRQHKSAMPIQKYRAFEPIDLPDRQWPGRTITKAPIWCSVDLRDGNQALIEPMDSRRKHKMFDALVKMGFKEIEVGFPAASDTDFNFVREIIEQGKVPADVSIQVLTQARPELIERTFEAIKGAPRAIVHLYNSTSTLQRRVVFGMDRDGITEIAVKGAELCKKLRDAMPETEVMFEYSPESFTGTELDFARDVCAAVMDVWEPTPDRKVILNLPATVEMASPNIYADQIEWMHRNLPRRDSVILSLHPHNDRGTGVAAAELGILAGADRIEGTLFGNGERTGNVDVINIALNMFTQGIDPQLEIGDINELRDVAIECNQLPIHPRHPYVGDLVFTAFSGSHQDAIKKGMAAKEKANSEIWEVPYLPIDPQDLGRSYEAIVRVNSQSGKGGISYLIQRDFNLDLPKALQASFSKVIQKYTDETGKEVSSELIWDFFEKKYLTRAEPFEFVTYRTTPDPHASERRLLTAEIKDKGKLREIHGKGNGPIDAFVNALRSDCNVDMRLKNYTEHAVGTGADAAAVAYVEVEGPDGSTIWGVGIHPNIVQASLKALISAANQASDI
jgi:2-isopropylmalate synthase